MDFEQVEDKIIEALSASDAFAAVESAARRKDAALQRPSASVYLAGATRLPTAPRPVYEMKWGLLITAVNLAGEGNAAGDAYALINAALGAIEGKDFSLAGIEPFRNASVELVEYEGGEISYELEFETRHYLPVP